MRDLRWYRSRSSWFLLLAVACLASGAAFAQSVTTPYYIVVQPIDVCNSAGTSCAPVNSKGQSFISTGGGPNMPVGFFDPTTGANITQTILLNTIGVNVVFLPLVQYKSGTNPYSTLSPPDFLTLHVTPCTTTCPAGLLTSADLALLGQQPAISNTGTVPNPTTPAGVPVSPTATVINLFFVNTLVPNTPGQLYGFTWKVGANGVAIGSNTMVGVPLLGLPPRPDTFAHELGHVLGLDHAIFGAGPYDPYGPSNLEGGVVPPIPASPSVGVCTTTNSNTTYPACAANLMTAGGMGSVNLRTEPTIANALASLSNGTADQVTTVTQQGSNLPTSQQTAALSSGFININPNATLTVTDPNSALYFTVSQPEAPINVLVIMLPSELKLDPKNQFKIISESRKNLVMDVDYYPDADNNPNNPNAKYLIGAAYSACTAAGAQCVIVEFNSPGLGPTDSLEFSQGVLNGKVPATLQQLAGAYITFGLIPPSSGSTTTSQFLTTSELMFNSTTGEDTASTQTTSNMLPPPVITGTPPVSGMPCTPFWDANGTPSCKFDYIIVDGDPSGEGGQP